jgi:hypothetical protein
MFALALVHVTRVLEGCSLMQRPPLQRRTQRVGLGAELRGDGDASLARQLARHDRDQRDQFADG